MRIMNPLKNIDRIAAADGEHRRDKIAKAIDGQAHGLVIRRAEKRRGDVSQVMLDGIERRELFPGIIQGLANAILKRANLRHVAHAIGSAGKAARMREGQHHFAQKIRLRLARYGQSRDAIDRAAVHLIQAVLERVFRKAGPVLDAGEALFLDADAKLSARERGRRGVAVKDVQTNDDGIAIGAGLR